MLEEIAGANILRLDCACYIWRSARGPAWLELGDGGGALEMSSEIMGSKIM